MKAQYKILATLIAGFAYNTAFADLPKKAATRIEFNSMIDQNNADKKELQKSVSNKMTVEPDAAPVADQKKVLDLVDVEVGVGEDRPVVVDRRYNSVGAPLVDSRYNDHVQVTLPDDKKVDSGS